ncbi:MAG: peptidase, partial [Chloroflexia bacterium]|nr:peptidase [Chloroflexia bacterium]
MLEANDIHIGHRYFNGSKPNVADWQYLTIKQAADDHHRIVEFFKPLFSGPWISTGGSKSGVTALFHRRYYPNVVKASVALVAPISRETEDPRYNEYILTLGTEEERNTIKSYQRGLLLRKEQLVPKIDSLMKTYDYSFSLSAAQILEINAIEFWFSFWQYYEDFALEEIPDENASVDEYFDYFEEYGSTLYYSDPYLDYYKPLYYQIFTELGYCKQYYGHLSDLLTEYPNFSYK